MGTPPRRFAACCLAAATIVGAGSLALAGVVSARPQVSVKAKIVPIPVEPSNPKSRTYPHTGNLLGAPAALEATLEIKGEEYFGAPSPVTKVLVDLPADTKLHPQGFTDCPLATLESHEVQKCPKKSYAGPTGEVLGVVSFGSSRVREKGTIQPFFAPGGRLAFYTEGREPALIEVLAFASISTAPPPFGPRFSAEVPLVPTVPEAPYASVLSIKSKIGAAFMQGKKLISYGTVPKKCPKGGFKGKVQLTFLSGETVTAEPTVPCPKR
ncbi:MAG TPA: hypothetical protein VHS55_08150 [Solirubrobacteraceae bacterium]|jgi:hypothetical protein|nr:hypothetical protein [Solirubrobacteraceae bacterium]